MARRAHAPGWITRRRDRGGGRRRRAPWIATLAVVVIAVVAAGCSVLPAVPAFPAWGKFGSRQAVVNQAQANSSALEQYVKDVLDGKKPPQVPASLLPDGLDPTIKDFVVLRPDQVDANKQWMERDAKPIDWNAATGNWPDPHTTYYFMPYLYAPFGSKVIVEGDFPHSRFFSLQVTPGFNPENYKDNSYFGEPEVPFLDADIAPDPGSTNPFRVGADRNATQRHYKVNVDLKIADSAQLDPAFKPPFWRSASNTRLGSGISFQGPWGDPTSAETSTLANKRGYFNTGELWTRIYAPDKNAGPRGGVGLPRVLEQLPDGRQYFISANFSAWTTRMNATSAVPSTLPADPGNDQGSGVGWYKQWGILRNGLGMYGRNSDPYGLTINQKYVRDLDKGALGRSEDLPGAAAYEPSATLGTNINYLTRMMSLGWGRVLVISGKLPTTPKTRNGEATMTASQLRYFSISSYDVTPDLVNPDAPYGKPITSVMDDEIVTDANGNFVLVYSRPEDRPANATAANGVTWVNWGPTATQNFLVRYMSVGPEWTFAQAPTSDHLGRATDWASPKYNGALIGQNNRNGFLGAYQPVLGYTDKWSFQGIRGRATPTNVPVWYW